MPEERAEVPPVVCERVAVVWVWERCGEGGVADEREEGDARLVARREEDRVRERCAVFEHRCVGSEMRDGTNAFYSRDVREGEGEEWQ